MFSQFMPAGLLLAIGVTGVLWWALKEFTPLVAATADGIAMVGGLAIAMMISLINRNLQHEPIQVVIAAGVLGLGYGLFQLERKRRLRKKSGRSLLSK